jgi:transcriptional regulator with XRE-family HTH domain
MRRDRLRQARELKQLSQEDLATRIGTTKQQIYRYESGVNIPSADVLGQLAQTLEVSADYLVGLVSEPNAHLSEDDLSPMERLLIQAVRAGRIGEAVKTAATLAEERDETPVAPDEPAIDSKTLQRRE